MPRPDWNQTDPRKADYIRNKPSIQDHIVCVASGEVVSVKDASDRPLKNLTIYGKTTQNGTPTPQSPVPLESAGASGSIGVKVLGKNLLDEDVLLSLGMDKVGEHEFYSNQIYAVGGKNIFINTAKTAGSFTVSGLLKYAAPSSGTSTGLFCVFNYTDGTSDKYNPSRNVTIQYGEYFQYDATSNKNKIVDSIYMTYGSSQCHTHMKDFQIELGATATEFEPYKEQTLTVATPGGLNGIGDVRDYIDFEKGVYVQCIGTKAFEGTETWYTDLSGSTRYFNSRLPYPSKPGVSYIMNSHGYNNEWKVADGNIYITGSNADGFLICPGTEEYPTVDAWKAQLVEWASAGKPLTVYYAILTPIETPLTEEQLAAFAALHSNKPATTVLNDGGVEMSVAYVADTKLYIDNKFNELATAILNNA
jgi:hypothetical protein